MAFSLSLVGTTKANSAAEKKMRRSGLLQRTPMLLISYAPSRALRRVVGCPPVASLTASSRTFLFCPSRFKLEAVTQLGSTAIANASTTPTAAPPASGVPSNSSGNASVGDTRGPPSSILLESDITVSAYHGDPNMAEPVARGTITGQIADNVYTVMFLAVPPPAVVVELGSRVVCRRFSAGPASPPTLVAGIASGVPPLVPLPPPAAAAAPAIASTETVSGLVAKVYGNGVYAILFDDDRYDPRVTRDQIVSSEGPPRFMDTTAFRFVLAWARDAGVVRQADQEATACILFHRGWRVEKLYLLEAPDVHCLSHLNKSVRMGLLERAEWERDKHRQRRDFAKERLKEQEWRYTITKYSSAFSACVAVLGVISMFTWNFKNWQKASRGYQLAVAVDTIRGCRQPHTLLAPVARSKELADLEHILRQMDTAHPRIVLLTGAKGSGKSILVQAAASQLKLPALHVSIRDKEEPLRVIVKHMGVPNIDLCGDLLDFVSEAFREVKQHTGKTPLLLLKLLDAPISTAYAVAEALGCDRAVCHVVIEGASDRVDSKAADLLHVDAYTVGTFTREEAVAYVGHKIDPLDLNDFIDIVGTNPNDLDELIAVVQQRGVKPRAVIQSKLSRAVAHLRRLACSDKNVAQFLRTLVSADPETGLDAHSTSASLGPTVEDTLRRFVIYNHTTERWQFGSLLYYHAAKTAF